MKIRVAEREGRMLSHKECFYDRGVGKTKAHRPRPGVRAWFFKKGDKYYVTHFTAKDEHKAEQAENVAYALEAREQHDASRQP